MNELDKVRTHISKAEIASAFKLIKEYINSVKIRKAAKILDTILLLEYQYNEIKKNNNRLELEQVHAIKNRIIYSFLLEVTELELLTKNLNSKLRKLKKVQLVTELNLVKSYSTLSTCLDEKLEDHESVDDKYLLYLKKRIEKLEEIHSKIINSNNFISYLILWYFILKSIESFVEWDSKTVELLEHDNSWYPIDNDTDITFDDLDTVDGALLIDDGFDGHGSSGKGDGLSDDYDDDD